MVVVGAGIAGAAVARELAMRGAEVVVVERGSLACGASSHGEGNLLVSDKLVGPELELAKLSLSAWRDLADLAGERFEYRAKGGLVVALDEAELGRLERLAAEQARSGVSCELLAPQELAKLEPELALDLAGGVFYPEDAQVQPMAAVRVLIDQARSKGAKILLGQAVLGARRGPDAKIVSLLTTDGPLSLSGAVFNCAGVEASHVARVCGGFMPLRPRRGVVLVVERCRGFVNHKVYEAGYVSGVYDMAKGAAVSAVVESTEAGTLLLGSSREWASYSSEVSPSLISAIARRAVRLFPKLAQLKLIRYYVGFRPTSPDGFPIIGRDISVTNLYHVGGQEGAGVGLALGAAALGAAWLSGDPLPDYAKAFAPERFGAGGTWWGWDESP